jgi:hypothetical protein
MANIPPTNTDSVADGIFIGNQSQSSHLLTSFNYPEALQDTVHQEIGKSRAGKSGKSSKSRLKS